VRDSRSVTCGSTRRRPDGERIVDVLEVIEVDIEHRGGDEALCTSSMTPPTLAEENAIAGRTKDRASPGAATGFASGDRPAVRRM